MAIVLPFMERHEVDTLGITSRNDKNNKIGQTIFINDFYNYIFHVYSLHAKVYDFKCSLKLKKLSNLCSWWKCSRNQMRELLQWLRGMVSWATKLIGWEFKIGHSFLHALWRHLNTPRVRVDVVSLKLSINLFFKENKHCYMFETFLNVMIMNIKKYIFKF